MPNDFRERPGNRREFSGPVAEFVRPAEPSGLVALPFGGHAKAKVMRRVGLWQCLHRGKEFNTESTETQRARGRNGIKSGGRATLCPANDSRLAGKRRCGGRAETANCGACL